MEFVVVAIFHKTEAVLTLALLLGLYVTRSTCCSDRNVKCLSVPFGNAVNKVGG